MRDRRDAMTADLFDDHVVARNVVPHALAAITALLEVANTSIAILERRWRCAQPAFSGFAIKSTGPLTDDEKDLIEELAELGLKPWSIARRLERHPSTVTWFMSTVGLKKLDGKRKAPFMRAGRQVRPFTDQEDDFAAWCSRNGDRPATIARKLTERFGYPRSKETVNCRLIWLASDEAAREAA